MIWIASCRSLRGPSKRWLMASAILPSATVAGFHELLPCPSDWTPPVPTFLEDLRRVGISRIFFLRHGQTAKSDTGVDFDRYLTETGREQSRVAGASYGKEVLMPLYEKILVSPAPRTVETAEIFLQAAMGKSCSQTELLPTPDLYDQTMQPEGSKLFAKIGYAPLLDYLQTPGEGDQRVARNLLSRYAVAAVQAIHQVVQSVDEGEALSPSSTLLIVAHAIYLPAAALGVASLVGDCMDQRADVDVVLSTNTQEAEGYLLDLESASVSYLSRPKP